jgi:hypothetical protein
MRIWIFEESSRFFKKRRKNFGNTGPCWFARHGPSLKMFFASFFQKRSASFLNLEGPAMETKLA